MLAFWCVLLVFAIGERESGVGRTVRLYRFPELGGCLVYSFSGWRAMPALMVGQSTRGVFFELARANTKGKSLEFTVFSSIVSVLGRRLASGFLEMVRPSSLRQIIPGPSDA